MTRRTVDAVLFYYKKGKRVMNDILVHLPNETEDQCLWRIGKAKDAGTLTENWPEIALFLNKTFREDDILIETIKQFHYSTEQEKLEHKKLMEINGFTDNGQVKENIGTMNQILKTKYL